MILGKLNEVETKFKQNNKKNSSNFIISLKLNNRSFDQNEGLNKCEYLNIASSNF